MLPIIPEQQNPVGQSGRIRKTRSAVNRVIDSTRKWTMAQVDNIPVVAVNAPDTRYRYLIDLGELRRIIEGMILRLGQASEPVVTATAASYEEGTAKSVLNLSRITDTYTRTITQVIASAPYLRRAALIRARVFEEMQGFAGETGRELGSVLSRAVEDGVSPMTLRKSLAERFDVSKARAERIARTEITGALRRARLDEADEARENLGIRTGMLWFSALSATTRQSHAARHGRIYTSQEVRQFYAVDANGINCYLPGTSVQGRFVGGSKAHYWESRSNRDSIWAESYRHPQSPRNDRCRIGCGGKNWQRRQFGLSRPQG